jgi:hypothetical protein
MSIHAKGKFMLGCRFECLFSMALLPGAARRARLLRRRDVWQGGY